jgi:hypothetical protein
VIHRIYNVNFETEAEAIAWEEAAMPFASVIPMLLIERHENKIITNASPDIIRAIADKCGIIENPMLGKDSNSYNMQAEVPEGEPT